VRRPTQTLGGTLSGLGVPPNERESGTRPAAHSLGTLVEPSGAAALAALLEHDMPGERVAVVLTGSVLRPEHLSIGGRHFAEP
jgi:threonine synthase